MIKYSVFSKTNSKKLSLANEDFFEIPKFKNTKNYPLYK